MSKCDYFFYEDNLRWWNMFLKNQLNICYNSFKCSVTTPTFASTFKGRSIFFYFYISLLVDGFFFASCLLLGATFFFCLHRFKSRRWLHYLNSKNFKGNHHYGYLFIHCYCLIYYMLVHLFLNTKKSAIVYNFSS